MTTSVPGSIGLVDTDVSTLSGTPAGYLVTLSEAAGATAPAPLAVALGVSSFSVSLNAGTWTATVQAVDASGNPIGPSFTSNAHTVTAPVVVTVKMPNGVTLGA
jgi:hypothetical protein